MEEFLEGIGNVLTITQVVFIILKCAGLVTWSWWFVFTPLFIAIGTGIVAGIILGLVILLNQKKLNK